MHEKSWPLLPTVQTVGPNVKIPRAAQPGSLSHSHFPAWWFPPRNSSLTQTTLKRENRAGLANSLSISAHVSLLKLVQDQMLNTTDSRWAEVIRDRSVYQTSSLGDVYA
jgi:hypothetical protein